MWLFFKKIIFCFFFDSNVFISESQVDTILKTDEVFKEKAFPTNQNIKISNLLKSHSEDDIDITTEDDIDITSSTRVNTETAKEFQEKNLSFYQTNKFKWFVVLSGLLLVCWFYFGGSISEVPVVPGVSSGVSTLSSNMKASFEAGRLLVTEGHNAEYFIELVRIKNRLDVVGKAIGATVASGGVTLDINTLTEPQLLLLFRFVRRACKDCDPEDLGVEYLRFMLNNWSPLV